MFSPETRTRQAPEQATAVTAANWSTLLGLVDKSLVKTRGDNRFDLHELTRQCAAIKLAESGQMAVAQHAHFVAYEAFAKQANHWFTSPKASTSFRRSHQEQENYRVALQWDLDNDAIEAVLVRVGDRRIGG